VPRNILAARNIAQLRTLAGSGALLAFDFDGTLAPMGSNPSGTTMRDETLELLTSLAHAAPVAVITGRSVADATPRFPGVPLLAVIGNHGAEPSPFAKRALREVAEWIPHVRAAVAQLPGTEVEDKGHSVCVHYWTAAEPRHVIASIERLLPQLPRKVTMMHGIGLMNLVPHGAPDKGDALLRLIATHRLPGAVFVGDELTDESAFRAAVAPGSLGVRVGRWSASAASSYIPSQRDIDALLLELLIGSTRSRRVRDLERSADLPPQ
jgi:trehalose 6-phosphate phosphatase